MTPPLDPQVRELIAEAQSLLRHDIRVLGCGAHYCHYCPAKSPAWEHTPSCPYIASHETQDRARHIADQLDALLTRPVPQPAVGEQYDICERVDGEARVRCVRVVGVWGKRVGVRNVETNRLSYLPLERFQGDPKVKLAASRPDGEARPLTRHGGNVGASGVPYYLFAGQQTPEYDQGDWVVVWYDDLYDLANPRSTAPPVDGEARPQEGPSTDARICPQGGGVCWGACDVEACEQEARNVAGDGAAPPPGAE